MYTITLQIPQSTLDNFKKVIEDETGYTVTDPLALLTANLQTDARNCEEYAYMVAGSDSIHEEDWEGLQK